MDFTQKLAGPVAHFMPAARETPYFVMCLIKDGVEALDAASFEAALGHVTHKRNKASGALPFLENMGCLPPPTTAEQSPAAGSSRTWPRAWPTRRTDGVKSCCRRDHQCHLPHPARLRPRHWHPTWRGNRREPASGGRILRGVRPPGHSHCRPPSAQLLAGSAQGGARAARSTSHGYASNIDHASGAARSGAKGTHQAPSTAISKAP